LSQAIVASNYLPSLIELERDTLVLKQCYINKNPPQIPQGLIISDSNEDTRQKQIAAGKVTSRASKRLDIMIEVMIMMMILMMRKIFTTLRL